MHAYAGGEEVGPAGSDTGDAVYAATVASSRHVAEVSCTAGAWNGAAPHVQTDTAAVTAAGE